MNLWIKFPTHVFCCAWIMYLTCEATRGGDRATACQKTVESVQKESENEYGATVVST
jgi:hypothetical protein